MILPRSAFRMMSLAGPPSPGGLTYQFHAVDFLGLREDNLDPVRRGIPGRVGRWTGNSMKPAAANEPCSAGSVVTLLEVATGRRQSRMDAD